MSIPQLSIIIASCVGPPFITRRFPWVRLVSIALMVAVAGIAAPVPLPPGQYRLNVSSTSVAVGSNLTVTWQAPLGSSATDWVGLYLVGSPDDSFLWWTYTNGTATGSATFTVPKIVGQCELRYYLNNGYTLAAKSQVVTVTASNTPSLPPAPTRTPSAQAVGPSLPRGTRFVMRDYLRKGWKNELVFFTVPQSVYGQNGYKLEGPGGTGIPYQWADNNGQPSVAFLADVPELGQSEYKLAPGVPTISTDLTVVDLGAQFEVKNSKIGIRIRTGTDALTMGPIAGIRLPSGAWVGSGRLILPRPASNYQARVVAQGTVYVDVEATYNISTNSFWKLRFRVMANEPVALVDEIFSGDSESKYELSLNTGFGADQMFWRREDQASGSQSISSIGSPDAFLLEPWYHWWEGDYQGDWVSFYLSAGPDLLGIATRDAGSWVDAVRTNWEYRVPISKTDLTAQFQLQGVERKWMLFALSKAAALEPQGNLASLPQQLKIKHGEFPLDQVNRYILTWEDTGLTYPRLFVGPKDITALQSKRSSSELDRLQAKSYQFNIDDLDDYIHAALVSNYPVLKGRLAAEAVDRLQQVVDLYIRQTQYRTAGHDLPRHYNEVTLALNILDAALVTGLYKSDEKQRIRAQLAFLGYTLASPLVISPERGYTGNYNMTSVTRSALGVLACLIADHPQSRIWADTAIQQMSDGLNEWAREQGGWIEAPHYASVALDSIFALSLALRRSGFADREWVYDPRLKGAIRWITHIITPRDPQLAGRRHMPAIGNTYLGERTSIPGWAAYIWKDRDPAFSREMQWVWKEQGYFHRPGIGGLYPGVFGYTKFILDPNLPSQAPQWGSELFPDAGAVFRAHFPSSAETYMHYIQGPLHRHYDWDEGSFILWGRGQPLIEEFGYYGRAPAEEHSRVDDGLDGVDGRILDFMTSANGDYLHGERTGWHRQILFVKDTQPTGPNYFVVGDSLTNGRAGDWRIWISTDETPAGISDNSSTVRAKGRFNVDLAVYIAEPAPRTLSSSVLTRENGASGYSSTSLTQRSVEFQLPAGGQSAVVLCPLASAEQTPTFTSFGDRKAVKIVSPQGTDYVFLGLNSFNAFQDAANFNGRAGIIQVRPGLVRITLFGKGQISYNGNTLTNNQSDSQVLTREFPQ